MTPREAIIGVHHKGCWGSLSTVPFPDLSMQEVGPIQVKDMDHSVQLTAIWRVTYPSQEYFERYLESLDKYEAITLKRVIRQETSHALLKVTWVSTSSSYQSVFDSHCLFTSPVIQEQGYEKYTIITESPDKVKEVLEKLNQIGEVKIFSVGPVSNEVNQFDLTPKQMQALMIALAQGYYTWPRKANLNDVALAAGQKRRTLQENLRRAESKVFLQLKKEFLHTHMNA